MASNITEQPSNDEDETFDLYDLRVEVVCPPGARILCGASPGDYFTLEGEILYLPPGQGFSIYSIGTCSCPRTTQLRTRRVVQGQFYPSSPRNNVRPPAPTG